MKVILTNNKNKLYKGNILLSFLRIKLLKTKVYNIYSNNEVHTIFIK
jgi:hypothetical protein